MPAAASNANAIARELSLDEGAVRAVLELFDGGATIPFVARYRKEATGGLDEQQLRDVAERQAYRAALESRRQTIERELDKQGVLSDALRQRLQQATTKSELEDLYLPYKPKRRTRGSAAKERGLEPLANAMWKQTRERPEAAADAFVRPDKDVADIDSALAGARDICAERLAESPELRARVRGALREHGQLDVRKAKAYREKTTKFDSYEGHSERIRSMPSHRALAIARGEREGVLKAKLHIDLERHHGFAASQVPVHGGSPWRAQWTQVVEDAVGRLVAPSAQSDARNELRERSDIAAIEVFARNLRELLMAPPFGAKPVLGIDPGQRTGCKCAVVSDTGKLLAHDVIHLVRGDRSLGDAATTLKQLVARHGTAAIAVGNGTHGRETEQFVKHTLGSGQGAPLCVSVSESGASIYSASDEARREFPDLDLTVRGAISIARRLQDPLAELVKLDPKTIGVGQYQHDVDQGLLASKLGEVVESCVNAVGVELNTASAKLLSFVSGIGPKLAEAIVRHREAHGPFTGRRQLREVKGLGPKAFEQSAGFLRIRGGAHPLDASAVHPERYALVERMAKDLGLGVQALLDAPERVDALDLSRYRSDDVGDFTLRDIVSELQKPGRDPRSSFRAAKFDESVQSLDDLKVGMRLEGVVTNVTAFGAFVDIGVHQDGLVHISQLADHFVRDPAEVAHVGQPLNVTVLSVDLERKRIGLSAKSK